MSQKKSKVSMGVGLAAVWVLAIFTAAPFGSQRQITAPQKAEKSATLGAEITVPEYELHVGTVSSGSVDASTQSKRVTVTLSIHNLQQVVLQISPGQQLVLEDNVGVFHSATAQFLEQGITIGGPILPGDSKSLNIDFELPLDSSPKVLHFDPGAGQQTTEYQL